MIFLKVSATVNSHSKFNRKRLLKPATRNEVIPNEQLHIRYALVYISHILVMHTLHIRNVLVYISQILVVHTHTELCSYRTFVIPVASTCLSSPTEPKMLGCKKFSDGQSPSIFPLENDYKADCVGEFLQR